MADNAAQVQDKFSGWLHKRGPTDRHFWMKRWCVLRGSELVYYVDMLCQQKKGAIKLQASSCVVAFEVPNAPGHAIKHRYKRPHGFVLDPTPAEGRNRRLFYFDAESTNTLGLWIDAIKQRIGNLPVDQSDKSSEVEDFTPFENLSDGEGWKTPISAGEGTKIVISRTKTLEDFLLDDDADSDCFEDLTACAD